MAHLASLASWSSTSLILLAGATAFGLTFLLNPIVRATALRFGLVSRPAVGRWGPRRVVARLGGVAMFGGFATASLLWVPLQSPVMTLLLGGALVFLVGLIDDLRPLRPYTKLFCQLIIGCVMVLGGVHIELISQPWLSIPLSVFWFVFAMNAFNLLDNMDGLAGGVGAIAALFCVVHAVAAGQTGAATMAAAVCGVCLGFLTYNFPPAKIFMGDSGSNLLGLSLATVALWGTWHHSTQLLGVLAVPLFLLAVPIFDTCFVTIQRLAHGRHPFSGGVDHVSHRMAILGLSPRQTVLVLYAFSLAFGGLSVASLYLRPLSAVVMWLSTLSLLLVLGTYLAKVKVYDLKREPLSAPEDTTAVRTPTTLIRTMLMHKRRLVEVLVDFSLICAAYVMAHLLRFETTLSPEFQHLLVQSLPIILVIKLCCFAGFGLYRGIWRYVGLPDLLTIFKAVTLGSLLSTITLVYLWRFEGYSRTVFIMDWLLLFLAVCASRVAERFFNEWITAAAGDATPVVIIGAGDTGEQVLRQTRQIARRTRRIIGFLDDDPRKQGSRIHGCEVLGTRADLGRILDAEGVREVLIAIVDPPGQLLQHVRACCEPREVAWHAVTSGFLVPDA